MRVAVVTSSPPMAEGGHMVIARSLVQALREAGHDADVVITPQNRFGRQAAAYLATWLTDLGTTEAGPIDRVISLRFPSYAVRHPHHVCWLSHTMREYYDLWPQFSAKLSRLNQVKERVRRTLLHSADRYLLTRNVDHLFVLSKTVQDRFSMWPGLRSTVLFPPPPPRPYRCDEYGDYIFMVSRLTPHKRADLLLRALATTDGRGIRAVIGGDGSEGAALLTLAQQLGVSDRVIFTGALSEVALLGHLARCRAVCFPPIQEDYGFVTVEAFASAKLVITCRDSGGPVELIADSPRGYVCDPTPEALGGALRRVMDDREEAERMGAQALAFASTMTWSGVVQALTALD